MKWGWLIAGGALLLAGVGAMVAVGDGLGGPGQQEAWWEARQPACGVTLAISDHDQAAQLAGDWLIEHQHTDGSFPAGRSASAAPDLEAPSPIRQATALVALARWAHAGGGQRAFDHAIRALDGWEYIESNPEESIVVWPGSDTGDSSVLALVLLAHSELLQHPNAEQYPGLRIRRDRLVKASVRLRASHGRIHSAYDRSGAVSDGTPSAMADGAMLLAWYQSASSGVPGLQQRTLELAEVAWLHNRTRPLQVERDPLSTKSLFPWGLEALVALGSSDWLGTEDHSPRAELLSVWMIEDHQMLRRAGNTAYALQGLATAASRSESWSEERRRQLRCATDRGLHRLYEGQLGHSLSDREVPTPDLRGALHLGSAAGRYRLDHVAYTLLAATAMATSDSTTP